VPQADKHGRDTADTPVPKTDVVIIIVRRTQDRPMLAPPHNLPQSAEIARQVPGHRNG